MRAALLIMCTLAPLLLRAEVPQIVGVAPTPLHPGRPVTVTARYVPEDAKHITIQFTRASRPSKQAAVVRGGVIGTATEFHAIVPADTPDGEYRVYLLYDGLRSPGLAAPQPMRVLTPAIWTPYAWVAGLLAILVGVVTAVVVTKRELSKLWRGADGKSSTSKFQFVLWTSVVLFTFTTIAALYLGNRKAINTDAPCSLPQNIWIVLGLSGITAIAAKGITVHQINAGQRTPTADGGLLTSEDGGPELFKVQLLTWTYVAIGIYLTQFIRAIGDLTPEQLTLAPGCHVPDIDTTLMVLMGLSQGTYLGKKLVTTDTPRLTSIAPATGAAGTTITLTGAAFGPTQAGSIITIDDQAAPISALWTDTLITFSIPVLVNGIPLEPGIHTIGLVVGGRPSAGAGTFTLVPNLTTVTPAVANLGPAMPDVTLTGDTFGAQKGAVQFDGSFVPAFHILAWTTQQIKIKLAPQHPNGQPWQKGSVSISVVANGVHSNARTLTLQ